MNVRQVRTAKGPVDATFRAPPSKSVTHRALVAAALASGPSWVVDPLDAGDTRVTRDGLASLGLATQTSPEGWAVEGAGGDVPGGASLFLDQSGTSLRFLLALSALGRRCSRLDGASRLRQRPVRELARAIERLGGAVRLAPGGGLPLQAGGTPMEGGCVELDSGRSSQFASALMLIGARLPGGLDLCLRPPVVSLPYVELTARVLAGFGVEVERTEPLRWRVKPGDYPGRRFRVDGDYSSASYFMAAAAVVGGRVRVTGLTPDSSQPDARLPRILADLGCRIRRGADWVEVEGDGRVPPFDLELSDAPDLGPTLAVLALFSSGECRLRGIAHLRLKESDRLAVLAGNLRLLGRGASAREDSLVIERPGRPLRGGTVATASDHRIAMAFAVAGLQVPEILLDDSDCVSKSHPGFWEQFGRLEGSRTGS